MYIVTEKCLVANLPVNNVAYFKQKKKAVRFKNELNEIMNKPKTYKAFKYKVIKSK